MDVALAPLREGVPRATIPTKMYEAMASGLPVLTAAEGEARELVERERIGRAVAPGAANDFADAVRALADDPVERRGCAVRALELARSRFDRKGIAVGLDRLLAEIRPDRIGARA
jgi:glycosyltransferase involved in cell wall biosynthesis